MGKKIVSLAQNGIRIEFFELKLFDGKLGQSFEECRRKEFRTSRTIG